MWLVLESNNALSIARNIDNAREVCQGEWQKPGISTTCAENESVHVKEIQNQLVNSGQHNILLDALPGCVRTKG